MHFDLSESQQLLKNTARKFWQAECPLAEARRRMEAPGACDAALWKKIAEQGWTGVLFPEEFDGLGLGMVEMAVLMEEMGRALAPVPYLATVLMAGTLLDRAGTPAQKRRWLGPICRGEARATVALLEAAASWDPDGVSLAADKSAPGFTVNGAKLFVANAEEADSLICGARIDGELALLVIDRRSKGLTVEPMPAIDLTRQLYAVKLDHVEVPAENILATGAAARQALDAMLETATAGLAAEMVGGMQRVLEISVEYAKTRKQFGKPIGQFQAVQHMCADMLLAAEGSRSAAYYAAWAIESGAPQAALAVSVAKAYAGDAYRETGNRGIQVHGGMGFTWENDVHLYYRRAKASDLLFGDSSYHREKVARLVVDHD